MQEPQLLHDIDARLMEEAHEEGPTPAQAALAAKPQQGLTTRLAKHVSAWSRNALLRHTTMFSRCIYHLPSRQRAITLLLAGLTHLLHPKSRQYSSAWLHMPDRSPRYYV